MTLTEFNFRNRKGIKIFKQLLLLAIAILFILIRPNVSTKVIAGKNTIRTIETRVEGKETEIKTYITRIGNEKLIAETMKLSLAELQLQLDSIRGIKDTVKIIQIQDTVIHGFRELTHNLSNTITNQDSVIDAQRYVINSKDTIIGVSRKTIRRVKIQRNMSILTAGAIGVLFLIK